MDSNITSEMVGTDEIKTIYLLSSVDEDMTRVVIPELNETDWDKIKELQIMICTEGGLLSDCFAIIDMVEKIKYDYNINITTIALGEIASAGFFLFLLGDVRIKMPNCRVFVHEHLTINDESKTYSDRIKEDKTKEKEVYKIYFNYTQRRLNLTPTKTKTLLKLNNWLTTKQIDRYEIITKE